MSSSTILIVEDNEMTQHLLVRQLAHLGVTDVAVAANGLDALHWLVEHECRLVLADCQMPEMDGFEMTRRIRAAERFSGKHLPIIAMSAGTVEEDSGQSAAAGMDLHVPKPAQMQALQAALEPWLGPLGQFSHP
ncbi:response regulator [Massilia yuzhufengensis]|uniref:Response regulator receiver domain-containing protein n=1 Tax=Massilia yuzhufengensis TaxID=1164594 RepID=A0A1I1T8Y2_9BURK|nr:response regulator [Massilia yuzhufengensis]SFD55055.1 Response regulator receiver domain-containing protein [Massilia yuzhufengensis]